MAILNNQTGAFLDPQTTLSDHVGFSVAVLNHANSHFYVSHFFA